MKRLLILGAMIYMMLSVSVFAEEAETFRSGDYEYALLENRTAEITKYNGETAELVVPSELDGYSVTSIGDGAFHNRSNLHIITLPDSIKTIGANPFTLDNIRITVSPDHPYLAVIDGVLFSKPDKRLIYFPDAKEDYVVPDGIQSIGDAAFWGCSSLSSIALPEGLTSIGMCAFWGCSNLSSILLPDGLTSIEIGAFCNCSNLSNITLPEGLTSIGDYAFVACSSLSRITLPDSIETIGINPFSSNNISISVSPDHPYLAIIEGVLFSKPDKRLVYFPDTKEEYVVPNGIQCIGDSAFDGCLSLSSITLPDGLTDIGNCAFKNCSSLSSIVLPEGVTSIGDSAFYNCSSLSNIVLPKGFTSIGVYAFGNCSSLTNITLPEGGTSIGDWAFYNCSSLSSITLSDALTSIGNMSFYECSNLVNIVLPEGVTSVGNDAFSHCESLSSITLPDSLTSIGDNVFYGCDYITITVNRGSYAAEYCKENGLNYTYPDVNDWLTS